MKLICVREPGYEWVSTPSDAVIRELINLGHKVFITDSYDYTPTDQYDWTLSFYEHSAILGRMISEKTNTKHFCHIETIPPWRYFEDCDVENYGLTKEDPEVTQGIQMKPMYQKIAEIWNSADVKTISNHCRLSLMKQIIPNLDNVHFRYPSIDAKSIEKAKKMYSPKREQNVILTLARMVKIKMYPLLIDVINNVQTPNTIWRIVGDGPELNTIQSNVVNSNIVLDIKPALWGWARFYEMQKANVFLSAPGGMPPIEASLLGCSSFGIEQQPTKHIPEYDKFMKYNFVETFPIYSHTQTKEAATEIDIALQQFDYINQTYNTTNKFLGLECNVLPSEENAKQIMRLINGCTGTN